MHPKVFLQNYQLRVVQVHSNKLDFQFWQIESELPSLVYFNSDHPRLCCVFKDIKMCLPSFPTLITCANMISTKLQLSVAWITGITTLLLNLLSLAMLLYFILKPGNTPDVKATIWLLSMNLSIAECLVSACLFSFSIFNVLYDGVFGIMADVWRQSWKCAILDFQLSLFSRTTLAIAAYISVLLAITIPSTVKPKSSQQKTLMYIGLIWIVVAVGSFAKQYVFSWENADPLNYFCLPFSARLINSWEVITLHVIVLAADTLMVSVCVSSYTFLFLHIFRARENVPLVNNTSRKRRLKRCAIRMAVLILSTSMTWIPVITIQLLVLTFVGIAPNAMFWCVLITLPVNLVIDPMLMIRSISGY